MQSRIAATALVVLLVAALGGVVGGFLGGWFGGIQTRGCIEMDCLMRGIWVLGGVFVGVAVGAPLAWWIRGKLRPSLTDKRLD